MGTKAALRERYVKAQQEGTFVERPNVYKEYTGTLGDIPIGKQVEHGVLRLGTANPITVELKVLTGEEKANYYIPWAEAANSIKLVFEEREPVERLYRSEEAFPRLRVTIKEQIEVYPGYSVSTEEYERRFRGVDLDFFQKVLPPELFKAYVHTMGSIEGWGIKPKNRFKGKD